MDHQLVEFVDILRQQGMAVSSGECVDAVRALVELGVENRHLTLAALKATLCKRQQDEATLERVFALYFSRTSQLLNQLDISLLTRIEEEGLLQPDELQMIAWYLNEGNLHWAPLTRAVIGGDAGAVAGLLSQAALHVDYSQLKSRLHSGFYARRLLGAVGAETLRTQLDALSEELKARGVSSQGVSIATRHLAEAMKKVEAAARAQVEHQLKLRVERAGDLTQKPLFQLSAQELVLAQKAVWALAEKLKARLVRRERSRRRGQLSPRHTLRKNLSTGGVPMVPQFRRRRVLRPDVVVLCDVSESVRNTSRLMLLFSWSMHSVFRSVRSFIFVSDVGEISSYFRRRSADEALEEALQSDVISLGANSNYGRSLAFFARQSLQAVTRRTTVFIIGDGRSNMSPPEVWALEAIKQKAKRVVWICPEPRANWGLGDSEMLTYEKHVNQVIVVQSLGGLSRVASELVTQ